MDFIVNIIVDFQFDYVKILFALLFISSNLNFILKCLFYLYFVQ
jgi:hypothetical protein